jgi:hypothetical protein
MVELFADEKDGEGGLGCVGFVKEEGGGGAAGSERLLLLSVFFVVGVIGREDVVEDEVADLGGEMKEVGA